MVGVAAPKLAARPRAGARGRRLVRRVARRCRNRGGRDRRRGGAGHCRSHSARRGDEGGHAGWRRRRLGTCKRVDNQGNRGELEMQIKFHGHACFEITDGEATVVVDPFLKPNNPVRGAHGRRGRGDARPSHPRPRRPYRRRGRGLQENHAAAVAIVETGQLAWRAGVEETFDPNLGGTVEFDWGSVKLVQAFHTNTLPAPTRSPSSADDGHADRPGGGPDHHDRRQDDLPRRRYLPVR